MDSALDIVLRITGLNPSQLAQALTESGPEVSEQVPASAEFYRIAGLPRRILPLEALSSKPTAEPTVKALVDAMSEAFSTPWGEQKLRPIQAYALAEIFQNKGLFAPILVGGGKTLIAYLAAKLLDAQRPLFLIPAKLRGKTRREFRAYSQHWMGPHPEACRIESYELLGRPQSGVKLSANGHELKSGLLERLKPDLIIMDEAHKVKNSRAAVTKRLKRYLAENPVNVVAMTGTISKRSLKDYAHVVSWALPNACPLPVLQTDLELWAAALDEKSDEARRVGLGALMRLLNEEETELSEQGEEETLTAARRAFRRRLVETPGIIASQEGELGTSLSIEALEPSVKDPKVEEVFKHLRTQWETPDGWPISDGLTMWRHARELSLGFFYRWNPRPPEEWLEPRKSWARTVRYILQNNKRQLDSEAQVAQAVDRGLYPEATHFLHAWREVKASFEPNVEAVWYSDEAVNAALAWLSQHQGIVWVEHVEFGRELSKRSGLPYYAREGKNTAGQFIDDHPPGQSLIASIASNAEGRNLQAWNKNLIMSPPQNGIQWEQLLGRTHRPGQEADEVQVWSYLSCLEHAAAVFQARRDATYAQDTTGQSQKLCYADTEFPGLENIWTRPGPRWQK